jgi:hypothetical protein
MMLAFIVATLLVPPLRKVAGAPAPKAAAHSRLSVPRRARHHCSARRAAGQAAWSAIGA